MKRLNWVLALGVVFQGLTGNVFATESSVQTERSWLVHPDGARLYYKFPNDEVLWLPAGVVQDRLPDVSPMKNPLFDWGSNSSGWSELDLAKSKETAMELNINPKLAKKYLWPLISRAQVGISDQGDLYNFKKDLDFLMIETKQSLQSLDHGVEVLTLIIDLGEGGRQNRSNNCPDGYLPVPGNGDYATPAAGRDFCVMKYDASMDRTGPAPRALSAMAAAEVNITRAQAAAACQANNSATGSGFHLITNAEWQTMARNIEATDANWSGGHVGQGRLSRGNSNSTAKAAPSTDDQPYSGTGFNNDGIHKRTHVLSNGEVVWDMAGSVWKWVADDLRTGQYGWQEYTNNDNLRDAEKQFFGPAGAYNSTQNVGKIYMWDTGAVLRGGFWSADTDAGVFAAGLNPSAGYSSTAVGFRCAYTP